MLLLRHIIAILLTLLTVFGFCACGSKNSYSKNSFSAASGGYTCTAHVSYFDSEYDLKVSVSGGGVFSAEIVSDGPLDGLVYLIDNDNMQISYKDIKAQSVSLEKCPYGFAKLLHGAFLKIITGTPGLENKNGKFIFETVVDSEPAVFVFDAGGFPKSLEIKNFGLKAAFSDFKY